MKYGKIKEQNSYYYRRCKRNWKRYSNCFALEGANITIIGQNEIIGKKTAAEISNIVGKKVLYCKANITKSDELKLVDETTINTYGNLDKLYCNAGIYPSSPIDTISEKE